MSDLLKNFVEVVVWTIVAAIIAILTNNDFPTSVAVLALIIAVDAKRSKDAKR
jgi:hypothetical protein